MKKKILSVIILASISVPSYAQFLKNLGKAIKEVAVGVLYGAVDNMVENSGDQQTIDAWNSIKTDIAPTPSYGSDAGNQLGHGDYQGAIISVASAAAIAAGVSEDIVALGNSGLNNMVNGDNTAAIIDVGQMVTHATGNYQFDYFFDSHREINQINRERRNNIKNGMSLNDADKIRNEKIANVIVDINEYLKGVDAERKARIAARKNEVRMALLQRGYSDMEADYLSTCMSIEDVETINPSWSSADEMLDYHNIDYRESPDKDRFFDNEDIVLPMPSAPPTIMDEPTPSPIPQPVVANERNNAIELIQETILDSYAVDEVELSDAQKSALDKIADKMNLFEDIQIVIIGHTCDIGTQRANQSVGERRAKEAKYYLIGKGISGMRIYEESHDYSEPVVENDSEEHRKQNRRVTFEIK